MCFAQSRILHTHEHNITTEELVLLYLEDTVYALDESWTLLIY